MTRQGVCETEGVQKTMVLRQTAEWQERMGGAREERVEKIFLVHSPHFHREIYTVTRPSRLWGLDTHIQQNVSTSKTSRSSHMIR